ncbi:dynamin family protein [Polaribacter litorisediminis]|uniref:dynamin family protein n=1 Tax=Polaribacter litorisediminis TaxID=1908341 RepID=UPI001CBED922|nr:dynamin family protein [Polaribacter litorisediminis]UAM96697.1 dynamin family protein [Polaribacter litorisediminis]
MLGGIKNRISKNTTLKEVFIEVNPYLYSSSKALKLIAGINEPKQITNSKTNVFNDLNNYIYSDDFENICNANFNCKFAYYFRNQYEVMKQDVLSSKDEDWTKIVLGGEFSAGKSSFLNSLLCEEDEVEFLPVSEKPTSVIPTYIYCSKKQKMQYVIGENKQNGKMLLSLHALLALGHEFERKYKISLGAFLNKLIIQQPIKHNFLNDVMFIDTPGYNKEDGESKIDQNTAKNAVKNGEVLFWLIDVVAGTVKKEDLGFIRENFNRDKPKVIIFNKADKVSSSEILKIIKQSAITLKAKNDNSIIDIVAYSSHEKQILKSYRSNKSWKEIFEKVKSKAQKKKAEQGFKESLHEHKEWVTMETNNKVKELDLKIKACNNSIIDYNNEKDIDFTNTKREINYYYPKRAFELDNLWTKFQNILERELVWIEKVGFLNNKENLNRLRTSYNEYSAYNREVSGISNRLFEEKINSIDKYIRAKEKEKTEVINHLIKERELNKKSIHKLNDDSKKFHEMINDIEFLLKKCIRKLNEKKSESNFSHLRNIDVVKKTKDIFDCVTNNDFDGFLDCLSRKTEISKLKNNKGYNILSWAVLHKKYDMVSVLMPKARRLIQRKENQILSALEIAEGNMDKIMINLLTK